MKTKRSRRKIKSAILEAVHDTAKGLQKAGVTDYLTLRAFDILCDPALASMKMSEFERLAQRLTKSITKTIRAIDRTLAYCEASDARMARLETADPRLQKIKTRPTTTHKELMASLPKKRRKAIHLRAAEIDAQMRKLKGKMTKNVRDEPTGNPLERLGFAPREARRLATIVRASGKLGRRG